jgi:hypothetical protein
MKTFYIKTLIFQTIFYSLLFILPCLDENIIDKNIWNYLIVTFYIFSVVTTFIVPMIKEIKNKQNKKHE